MTRDWSHEPYRKLLLRPSASFRGLSMLTQGLAYFLFREADEDGRVPFDTNFDRGCARLFRTFGNDPRERRLVVERLRALVAEGTILHVGDVLVAKNLSEINRRREPGKGGAKGSTAERPASAGVASDSRPASAGVASDSRPASAGVASDSRPASAGVASDSRPASAESSASAQDDSGDLRTHARALAKVGREVGREVEEVGGGCAAQPPPADGQDGGETAKVSPAIAERRRVGECVREQVALFPRTELPALEAWAERLTSHPDIRYPTPPKASLVPYVRQALSKLANKVTTKPEMRDEDRLGFVVRTIAGLCNDDKANGWASGKTDGAEGVCAPPQRTIPEPSGPAAPTRMLKTAEHW